MLHDRLPGRLLQVGLRNQRTSRRFRHFPPTEQRQWRQSWALPERFSNNEVPSGELGMAVEASNLRGRCPTADSLRYTHR